MARERSATVGGAIAKGDMPPPRLHRSASISGLSKPCKTGQRVAPGKGSFQSAFFTKLNYDVRCVVYSHMLPIFSPEDAWKGFALSCHQAHDELSEIAPLKLKNYLERAMRHAVLDGFDPIWKLHKEIDLKGGFAGLRRITLELTCPLVDEDSDYAWGNDPHVLLNDTSDPDWAWEESDLLEDLVTLHFSKITILLRTDEALREVAPTYFYQDDEQYPLSPFVGAMEHGVWKKMTDVGELFHMLCLMHVKPGKKYEDGTPGDFLKRNFGHLPRFGKGINTSCFAIAYDPSYDMQSSGYDLRISHPSGPWYGDARTFANVALMEEWSSRLLAQPDLPLTWDPLPRYYHVGIYGKSLEIGLQSGLGWSFVKNQPLEQIFGSRGTDIQWGRRAFTASPRCHLRWYW